MSVADSALARGFLALVAGSEFLMPALFVGVLFNVLRPFVEGGLPEAGSGLDLLLVLFTTLKPVALFITVAIIVTSGLATCEITT